MNKVIIAVLTLVSTTCLSVCSYGQVYFDRITTSKSCKGDSVATEIRLNYDGEQEKACRYLGSSIEGAVLKHGGRVIEEGSDIQVGRISKEQPLTVEFIVEDSQDVEYVVFSYHFRGGIREDTIPIVMGCYKIGDADEITISNSCIDTITLALPFVATQTDIKFMKVEDAETRVISSKSYYCCSYGNEVKIAKTDTGSYMYRISGCYTPSKVYQLEVR